jgi:hypothetical protein
MPTNRIEYGLEQKALVAKRSTFYQIKTKLEVHHWIRHSDRAALTFRSLKFIETLLKRSAAASQQRLWVSITQYSARGAWALGPTW